MHRAIGSRRDFSRLSEDFLLAEFEKCVEDIVNHELIQKMDKHMQHCNTTRLQHSINVSYHSFCVCYYMGWDYRSAARAGLMHDLFFYDWRTKKSMRTHHASWHPRIALDNARKITMLNKIEEDAIIKHMWPCTWMPPRYVESYVVTFVDKVCAICEMVERTYKQMRVAA